ncbi:MAG TPA: BMP family ABC transporter substrate-binding protein, partial [Clostridiaceae bacterium]|nr:BMP family ABC transporter substrate-binding protein [Clostridiaceae bacterium]
VIEAAKDMDKWAIGVDLDQNKLAPDNVLTSALKNVNVAIEDISSRILDGEDLGGQTVYYGLAEGGVGIAPSSDKHVPAKVLEKTAEIEAQIISGDIVIPITEDEYDAFIEAD